MADEKITDPQVIPYLLYADAGAAMDWLVKTFGFTVRARDAGQDGTVRHGELQLDGGGIIMVGSVGPGVSAVHAAVSSSWVPQPSDGSLPTRARSRGLKTRVLYVPEPGIDGARVWPKWKCPSRATTRPVEYVSNELGA